MVKREQEGGIYGFPEERAHEHVLTHGMRVPYAPKFSFGRVRDCCQDGTYRRHIPLGECLNLTKVAKCRYIGAGSASARGRARPGAIQPKLDNGADARRGQKAKRSRANLFLRLPRKKLKPVLLDTFTPAQLNNNFHHNACATI